MRSGSMQIKLGQQAETDYVGAYESALRSVVAGCGSREQANRMVSELQLHYEKTSSLLKKAESEQAKSYVLLLAKQEANRIIEKHAPHTGTQFHDLVVSYSFAAIALALPLVAAASILTVITGFTAVGGTYLLSARIFQNWKATSAKRRLSSMAGTIGPKHVKGLPKIIGIVGKRR